MTQNFNPTISKRLWWFSKPFFYTAVLGLAFSFQTSIMVSPAHAIKKYSKDNGNMPCSSCHSRTGLSNGTMYPLTGTGSYFKTNGTLPPRAAPRPTSPVYPQQPQQPQQPPVYPQQPQQPVYPQQPQQPPVYPQQPQQPVYPQQPQQPPVYPQQPQQPVYPQQPQQPVYPRQPQQPVYPQPARNPHVDYCRRKYKSYNVSTDTWRGYDGVVRRCISPTSRGQQPVRRYNPPRANPRPYVPPRVNPRPYTPPPRVRKPVRQSGNYSCNQAKRLIRNRGYSNVRASNCADLGRYTFFAYRGGVRYRLRIRASDGVIYKVQRR